MTTETIEMTVSESLTVSADRAWSVVGGFDWLPAISTPTSSSALSNGGRVRTLVNRDGSILWERMLHFDDAERSLSYEIIDDKGCETMAYGTGFIGSVQVVPIDADNSTFRYIARFSPRVGVTPNQAREAVTRFVGDCAAGVHRALGRGTTQLL
ncbi:MAG: SRPBCC family protein [Terrimesophilobacter sp.]